MSEGTISRQSWRGLMAGQVSPVRVATDGTTVTGTGTTDDPLAASGGGSVESDGVTIGGNGTSGSKLHTIAGGTAVVTDGETITGNGTTASPLVATGGGGGGPAPSFGPVTFGLTNVQANIALADLIPIGFAADGTFFFIATRAGSITGLSSFITQGITGGSMTLTATVDGTRQFLSIVMSPTENQSGGAVTQDPDNDTFNAGDQIGIKIQTSADFATGDENNANLYAWIEIAGSV